MGSKSPTAAPFGTSSRHSLTGLRASESAVDVGHMRNVVLSGVVVIFEAIIVIGYLAMSVAARTALSIAPFS